MVHAGSHAVLAVGIAESLRLFDRDWNQLDRYLITTVAISAAWEIFDYAQWHDFKGPFPRGSVYDILSYQGAWIVPLIRERRYWQAGLVFFVWLGSIVVWELQRR